MNPNKDPFTDLAQLDKLNEKVLKIFARHHGTSEDMNQKSTTQHHVPESTVIGDEAEPKATEIPPPTV